MPITQSRLHTLLTAAESLQLSLDQTRIAQRRLIDNVLSLDQIRTALIEINSTVSDAITAASATLNVERVRYNLTNRRNRYNRDYIAKVRQRELHEPLTASSSGESKPPPKHRPPPSSAERDWGALAKQLLQRPMSDDEIQQQLAELEHQMLELERQPPAPADPIALDPDLSPEPDFSDFQLDEEPQP